MTHLINLLPWQPGYSGFGSYVQRVIPAISGNRLQLNRHGKPSLISFDDWNPEIPPPAALGLMGFLQANGMVQHGVSLKSLFYRLGFEPGVIYSPFFEALLCFPEIPQLITCHDLTPLNYPNSCKAWLKYRFWQPRHLACATLVVAISRHVADQLLELGMSIDRLVVVPNGIAEVEFPVLSPQSFDLMVIARHDTNKNLRGLLRAIAGVQRLVRNWHGVVRIVGRGVAASSELQALRRALPRPDGLVLIDQLDPQSMRATIRSSLALLSASLEEGFDYPVLEAKAEGIPTLLSDIPVHREFHHNSSLFFPIDDDGSTLADHVSQLMDDSLAWQHLSTAGLLMTRTLSVQDQQQQIIGLIEQLH